MGISTNPKKGRFFKKHPTKPSLVGHLNRTRRFFHFLSDSATPNPCLFSLRCKLQNQAFQALEISWQNWIRPDWSHWKRSRMPRQYCKTFTKVEENRFKMSARQLWRHTMTCKKQTVLMGKLLLSFRQGMTKHICDGTVMAKLLKLLVKLLCLNGLLCSKFIYYTRHLLYVPKYGNFFFFEV